MIGCDTSHCAAFAELLNDPSHQHHVPGGRVTSAFPGGSPDFELSYSRLPVIVETLQARFGVQIKESLEAVAEESHAILLTSVDGRVHLDQFRRIAPSGRPTFIDKPFALDEESAREMVALSERHELSLMSCSSLRYSEALQKTLADSEAGAVIGADFYGPMLLQETQPGLFWYGIHTVEMLYATLGPGCAEVRASHNESHDLVTAVWRDGRIGTIRGNRCGNKTFGGTVHRERGSRCVDQSGNSRPNYAGLLEEVMRVFSGHPVTIAAEETLEIIRFIEAANRSRESGRPVKL